MTSIPHDRVQPTTRVNERVSPEPRPSILPKRWAVHVGLIISCFVMGIPLLYALLVSTQNNSDVFAYRFTPGEDFQRNLELILSRDIFRNMLNSAMMAVTITVSKTILALLAGLAFVYFRFPGKWLVFGFVLLTLMMPTEILIVALSRFVAIDLKWGGTFQALVVPFIASATGTFLFRQHFANIPAELSEAAQLDGATPLQFLIRVLIPISWNTIGALAVIQFVYGWNMYLWPQLISQGSDFKVVTVALSAFRAVEGSNSIGPFMLVSVLVSIPPVIVFLLLQKQFMSGFALSRDK